MRLKGLYLYTIRSNLLPRKANSAVLDDHNGKASELILPMPPPEYTKYAIAGKWHVIPQSKRLANCSERMLPSHGHLTWSEGKAAFIKPQGSRALGGARGKHGQARSS
jgi:hypothetical protein